MKKIDKDQLINDIWDFFVGAAVGGAIITPFVIMGATAVIKDTIDKNARVTTKAINMNSSASLYPEDFRKAIEEEIERLKNMGN